MQILHNYKEKFLAFLFHSKENLNYNKNRLKTVMIVSQTTPLLCNIQSKWVEMPSRLSRLVSLHIYIYFYHLGLSLNTEYFRPL